MAGRGGTTGRAGLESANAEFYESFEALDLDRMDAVWDHGEGVFCIHPGGEVVSGWGPVHRAWAVIFANTPYLQFIVTDVRAADHGGVGLVTCTENILSGRSRDPVVGTGKAVATNVFTWRGNRWRMFAHHASPVLRGPVG